MDETLLSVGLDVGTTSTQMILSRLKIRNQASGFAVPEMIISDREILYKSPIFLTPLVSESRIDGEKVRDLVEQEYEKAGITRQDVDTGAIIITGETSRKENAQAVLSALSSFAGDFVVAAAGPDLESRLAAKGSGAVSDSRRTGKTLLHMDIGGGTSNLALIQQGEIRDTGCLNVGGRLLTYDADQKITWVSQALSGLTGCKIGDTLSESEAEDLANRLTEILEMAAGLRTPDERLPRFITREGKLLEPRTVSEPVMLSFSGGVADCIAMPQPWKKFGDLGPLLGQAIRKSRLCQKPYRLEGETIRATVIGAGCHSAQLSGSTVFYQNISFPLKNLPVSLGMPASGGESGEQRVYALPGIEAPTYEKISDLADRLAAGPRGGPLLICLEQDMAKALGQALALRLGKDARILCIDRIRLSGESYLDVGTPVGPAIPVVVKTLILEKGS